MRQREPLDEITVIVPGLAQSQGSKRYVGNGIMIDASKDLKAWRDRIAVALAEQVDDTWNPISAYQVRMAFMFQRPMSHYTGKNALKSGAPLFKITRPDIDKIVRAVLDAGTQSGVWRDDSQVWSIDAIKGYVEGPHRTEITIHSEREV